MLRGKFIVIEGLEGAGKTSAVQTVLIELEKAGIKNAVLTREPGGTPIAEALRHLIKEGSADETLVPSAELLVLYAARVQLLDKVILPALNSGRWVIGDRHDLSTQAYQGAGRRLDADFIRLLRHKILGNFKPDLTLYLDLPPAVGLKRVRERGTLDQIEQESLPFFNRVRQCYLEVAEQDPDIICINAVAPLNEVKAEIIIAFQTWFNQTMQK